MTEEVKKRKFLSHIVISGVDDDLPLKKMEELGETFINIEFQLLLSSEDYVRRRYASPKFAKDALAMCKDRGIAISAKINDVWLNKILDDREWIKPDIFSGISLWDFDRIQLDSTENRTLKGSALCDMLKKVQNLAATAGEKKPDFILRVYSADDASLRLLWNNDVDVHPLIDCRYKHGHLPFRPSFYPLVGYGGEKNATLIRNFDYLVNERAKLMQHGPVWLEVMDEVLNNKDFLDGELIAELMNKATPHFATSEDLEEMANNGWRYQSPHSVGASSPAPTTTPTTSKPETIKTEDIVQGGGFGAPPSSIDAEALALAEQA